MLIEPAVIQELSITQDIDKTLPTFRLKLADPDGILTHLRPFDIRANNFTFQFALGDQTTFNSFDFKVYRRTPTGEYNGASIYDVVGLLDANGLFAPSWSRSSAKNQTVKDFMIQIAGELGCSDYKISTSLDYVNTILQPNWTNAELLKWCRGNLVGVNGEGCFKIFISCENGKRIFNCTPWNELLSTQNYYKFIIGHDMWQDFYPIVSYEAYDNYMALTAFGGQEQRYQFFDYFGSQFFEGSITPTDVLSLTDYFMIDTNDTTDSDSVWYGRNHEATFNYAGKIRGMYHDRMSNLSKLWADSFGLQNLQPGAIVLVLFPQEIPSIGMEDYQYSGLWCVERIIHRFDKTFMTRMLLTRNGMDTSQQTTLYPAYSKVSQLPTFVYPSIGSVPSFDGVRIQ